MKPLSNTYRWTMFVLLGFVFVGGTPLLIGYSKGYRLSDALDLVATGGIYIQSDVTKANFYLDGRFVKRTGTILRRNTFIENLAPNRAYVVRVEKDGYQTWRKELPVVPNLVTEARLLMLPVPSALVWDTVQATTTAESTDTLGRATSSVVFTPEHRALSLLFSDDLDPFAVRVATTTYTVVKGVRVATTTEVIEVRFPGWLERFATTSDLRSKEQVREQSGIVSWLDDGVLEGMWVRDEETPPAFLCGVSCSTHFSIAWNEPIERYEFFPGRNDVVVVQTSRGIFATELDIRGERNVHTIRAGTDLAFRFVGGTIIVFDGTHFHKASL